MQVIGKVFFSLLRVEDFKKIEKFLNYQVSNKKFSVFLFQKMKSSLKKNVEY